MFRPSWSRVAALLAAAALALGPTALASPRPPARHPGGAAAVRPFVPSAGAWLWAALSGAWGFPPFLALPAERARPASHTTGSTESGCGIDPYGCPHPPAAPTGGRPPLPPPQGDSGCIIDPYGRCQL
jgi:hypothetical protein